MVMLAFGAAKQHVRLVRTAAVLAVLGVIVNRLNISVIAYRWFDAAHYVPSWMEIVVSITLVTIGIQAFRWIVNRMPVLRELPLVALRETVIFPEMIVPLQVGREKSVNALNAAVAEGGPIALVTQRQAEQEDINDPSELYEIGTLARARGAIVIYGGIHATLYPDEARDLGGAHA